MRMTIEQLDKKFAEAEKKKQQAIAYIEEQTENVQKLQQEEIEAAERGDLEKYQALKRQRTDLEDRIFVKRASLNAGSVEQKEVFETWKAYAAGYNKELATRTKEFEKACEVLKDLFLGLVRIQNNALEIRERCVKYSNLDTDDPKAVDEALPMDYINAEPAEGLSFYYKYADGYLPQRGTIWMEGRTHIAPLAFMGALKMISVEEVERIGCILCDHKFKAD